MSVQSILIDLIFDGAGGGGGSGGGGGFGAVTAKTMIVIQQVCVKHLRVSIIININPHSRKIEAFLLRQRQY